YAGKQIISASSEKEMRTPRNAQSKYGLALLENTDIIPGVTLVGHTGDAYGLYSNMYFDPAIGLGIVAITNGCVSGFDGDDLEFSKEVVSYLYAAFKE
ncbi:MAG TPA: serine hydrolase, partial [Candidatus Sphingobacterium stercoripullorum]|nr:serine hydrolase [Candidatus Sphingobacterium stercoripullorum]